MDVTRPIVYFAFANQRDDTPPGKKGEGYLHGLDTEIRNIKELFTRSYINNDLVFLIDESTQNAQLGNNFIQMKESLSPKFIHFSGHADKNNWVLADHTRTNSNNLANLLRGNTQVKLVFMNGCCTQELKNFLLHDVGVDAVIATSRSILDNKAADFATFFYKSWLTKNKTLLMAFDEACGKIQFNTSNKNGYRGIDKESRRGAERSGEEENDIDWGLYWKNEEAKECVLNDGFSTAILDEAKIMLFNQYEEAKKLVDVKAIEVNNELTEINEELKGYEGLQEADMSERDKKAFNRINKSKIDALKSYSDARKAADTLWLQLIMNTRSHELKEMTDEFNYSKELDKLPIVAEGIGYRVQNGVYLLRGTPLCGLGLLSYRIIMYKRPRSYSSIPPPVRIDFKGVSEAKDVVEFIKTKISLSNNLNVSTFEDLAKALSKFLLLPVDNLPFVLIFDNLSAINVTIVKDVLERFWLTLMNDIKDKVNVRPIIILLIETIEAAKKEGDDGDFDMTDEPDGISNFCGLLAAQMSKDNQVFPIEKVAKVNQDEFKVILSSKNRLFFDIKNPEEEFWDEEPYVKTILKKIASKMNDEALKAHIESRFNFKFS